MAADFTLKKGDTAPALVGTLKDGLAAVIDLTAADAVKFIMKDKASGDKVIDRAAAITSAAAGQVTYQWQTGDTDVVDTYNAEFEVAWSDGTFETFPNSRYIQIKIIVDLGGTVGTT